MYLHNDFTQCMRRGWELGTKDSVMNFESAIMHKNNVVFMNVSIMNVMFVISLTHKPFIELNLFPLG